MNHGRGISRKIIFMKHLKKFNETNSDIEFHMNQVKDSLQEVIDEFGLDRFGDGMASTEMYEHLVGYVYSLENSVSYSHPVIEVTISHRLKLGDDMTPEIRERMGEIKNSPEIRAFEKRLESIGYYIKKYGNTTNYMIDVHDMD